MKYEFDIENCDIKDKETLKRYREKRSASPSTAFVAHLAQLASAA